MKKSTSMRMAGNCVGLLTSIGQAAYEGVRNRAISRAKNDDREVVNKEDVLACAADALEQVAKQIRAGQRAEQIVEEPETCPA